MSTIYLRLVLKRCASKSYSGTSGTRVKSFTIVSLRAPFHLVVFPLTVFEEGALAGGVLVEVFLEGRVPRQAGIRLQAKQLGRGATLRSRLEVGVVEFEPLLRPALSARHADTC